MPVPRPSLRRPGADRGGGGVLRLGQDSSGSLRYYAVLPDGLQPISPVLAAILRNTNSYGLDQPPRLGADEVAKLPVSRMLDTTRYPDQQVALVDAAKDPVTCAYWSKPAGAASSSLSLLSGSAAAGARRGAHRRPGRRAAPKGSPPASPWRRAPATSPRPWAVARPRRAPARCSGSPTPECATASTTRPTNSGAAGHGKTVEALGLNATARSHSVVDTVAVRERARRYRAPMRCSHTTACRPTAGPVVRCRPKEDPDEPTDLRSAPAAGATEHPQGHHHHRGASRAAPGDSAVVAAARDALRDRDPDRRHDRRAGRHRDEGDLPADPVLPVRAAAGGDRALSRQRQQDAHRGGRRRTRRLPALPVGGPGQHPDPGRPAAGCRAVVPSRAGGTGHGARIPPSVGA